MNTTPNLLQPINPTRDITRAVECELWARAGGRCQIPGCNRPLFKSSLTQERVNLAEKAHIYSFSPRGPRGRGPYARRTAKLNSTENLLLTCPGCHKTIDQDATGSRYSAELLRDWKREHERRIARVTGIGPDLESQVVFYGSRIGAEQSPLHCEQAIAAMFPHRFPAEHVVDLAMNGAQTDDTADFWQAEAANLRAGFTRKIEPLIEGGTRHFSVFGLAGMPLLVLLGSLFTDKREVDVYQLHRNPKGWRWRDEGAEKEPFILRRPRQMHGKPVLVISLSAKISHDRIRAVLGGKIAVWELTIRRPFNDFLRARSQLAEYRAAVARTMVAINAAHRRQPIHIFPAMPVACAIELGRARMPKGDVPWIIYDHHPKHQQFNPTLTIGKTV